MSKITKTKFPLNKGWWKEWIQDAVLREREGGRAREKERVWKGRSDYIHEFSVVDLSGE